jgi:hypothetical protein
MIHQVFLLDNIFASLLLQPSLYSSGHLHILGPELADKLDFETGLILIPVTLT